MKFNNKEILEIAGAATVIASVAFVGLQLKLDRDVALADSFTDGIESRKEDIRAKMESDTFMLMQNELWEAGVRPEWWSISLENSESNYLDSGAQTMARFYEADLDYLELERIHFRYNQGLIDQDYWNGAKAALRALLTDPFRRAVFLSRGSRLSETVNELIAEIDRENGT